MLAAPALALTSRTAYVARLRAVARLCARALAEIIQNPARFAPLLLGTHAELASKQAYVSAILAVFKHTTCLHLHDSVRKAWTALNKELCALIEARALENVRTPHEEAARVSLAEAQLLEAHLRATENGSPRHLLLAWHTLWPPNRGGDAGIVRLLASPDQDDGVSNVLVLAPYPVFKLREHKTAKHHGPIERTLPHDLALVLLASLAARPRTHLFESAPHAHADAHTLSQPFASERAFQQWASRTFLKLFEKPVTVNSLRHAFVNALDLAKMSTRKLENVARAMGHTTRTQLRAYRRVDDDAPTDPIIFRHAK